MTASYFVRYQGTFAEPERFLAHYAGPHARILAEFPGIRSLILHRPAAWTDPFPVDPAGSALLAQMSFDSTEALNAALASDARRRARDDFANFPAFDGSVSHEAMNATVVF
jgi:uncharacterized protein (TIGR02118 family)